MKESELVQEQKEAVERLGCKLYLINQTRSKTQAYTTPGISDTMLVGHGLIIFNETKLDYNDLSPDQVEFKQDITKNGGLYVVTHSLEELLFVGEQRGMWKR